MFVVRIDEKEWQAPEERNMTATGAIHSAPTELPKYIGVEGYKHCVPTGRDTI